MSFKDFELAIKSPALKQVARYWNEVRGARMMPGWGDISPARIAGQLSIIWSYKYDREADAFTGRLAGSRIEQIFGKPLKGTPMRELYPERDFPRLFIRSKRVVCGPELYRGEGMVFKHVHHYGHGERIIMPLASDGVHGDGILGATDYKSFFGTDSDMFSECDSWFSL